MTPNLKARVIVGVGRRPAPLGSNWLQKIPVQRGLTKHIAAVRLSLTGFQLCAKRRPAGVPALRVWAVRLWGNHHGHPKIVAVCLEAAAVHVQKNGIRNRDRWQLAFIRSHDVSQRQAFTNGGHDDVRINVKLG